ncbi:MAG: glycosyltransferase family 4 protein [Chloroflexi bacterium]|nr:glycosyltransferase family 4 protein [Chloroflexota bacterium]
MRVLFAAYRHNPLASSAEIGADYYFYNSLKSNAIEVRTAGPFTDPPILLERIFKRLYKSISGKKYIKYDLSNTLRASRAVNRIAHEWKPDLIFSLYPPPLAFYNGDIPCAFRTDATFQGSYSQSPEYHRYGNLALLTNIWMERRALKKCSIIITHSDWARQSLIEDYKIRPEKIYLQPNPDSLPENCVPEYNNYSVEKSLNYPLRLLFIGRDPHRKGLDIAIETIVRLNHAGLHTVLTVCGLNGANDEYVTYVGNLDKSNEFQLAQYISLLKDSHLLLHPARFDPSPRVTSEAAAFGVPTITNDVGGLATSVKNGESGVVLPGKSPPEAYVQAIRVLVVQPEDYYALCHSTRARYDRVLNSRIAGKRLANILVEVVNGRYG